MKVRNLVSKRFKETPADCVIASQKTHGDGSLC